MTENRKRTTARGTNKKAGNRKKAPSQGASQNAGAPKDTAPEAAEKKAAGRKKAAQRRASKKVGPKGRVSAEERYRMIQEAAYFRAEQEGFNCDPWKCWLVAEAEVDTRLASSR
jgi:hypothetical protein